jgi:GMP synthase (glutamine-hydrolysing)
MKKYLFIIKVGATYPDTLREYGDFDLWTIKGLGCDHDTVRVIDAEHGDPLPDANDCAGVVVTGSHDMVTDNLPWSVRVAEWIPALVDRSVPFLGICFGHQFLAYALGGRVGFHPEGTEAGTKKINLLPESASDPLFAFLPLSFHAHVSHSQTVIVLPEGAVCLAMNAFEPNHAFRVGRCAWGVQFHPEYTADIIRSYIINEKDDLLREGIDIIPVLDAVRETPVAALVLRNFNQFVMTHL